MKKYLPFAVLLTLISVQAYSDEDGLHHLVQAGVDYASTQTQGRLQSSWSGNDSIQGGGIFLQGEGATSTQTGGLFWGKGKVEMNGETGTFMLTPQNVPNCGVVLQCPASGPTKMTTAGFQVEAGGLAAGTTLPNMGESALGGYAGASSTLAGSDVLSQATISGEAGGVLRLNQALITAGIIAGAGAESWGLLNPNETHAGLEAGGVARLAYMNNLFATARFAHATDSGAMEFESDLSIKPIDAFPLAVGASLKWLRSANVSTGNYVDGTQVRATAAYAFW